MHGSVGTPTTYGIVLPHLRQLLAVPKLSTAAKYRLRWIDAYKRWDNARKVCRRFGISSRTFYLWQDRFTKQGVRGLEDRSRKPHRMRSSMIPRETITLVTQLRRAHPTWSKHKISVILKRDHQVILSPSTVNRIFHRYQLFWPSPMTNHRKALRRWAIERKRAPKDLKTASAGSLVEIDVKYLTVFGTTFYQFTAVDTCTRIKFIRVYTRRTAKRGRAFLEELFASFPFPVRHIQSDNGGEFLADCHQFLEEHGITHYFSYPQCPRQQGHVERAIQSDEYEFWMWGNLASTVEELNHKADGWVRTWNTYRPHEALQQLTPMAYYHKKFAPV